MDPPSFIAVKFEERLREALRGDVEFDLVSRSMFATDASHYQILPACVISPRDAEDAVAAVRIAGEFGIPITARGGGTSLSGQTTWTGMILDFSRHMHQILEIHVRDRWARIQPGAVRDEVNRVLASQGLHFAPDPATGNRAAIGGMIGNNSSGTRSILYGRTIDHVLGCKVVLADGTILDLKPMASEAWNEAIARGGRLGEICAGVGRLIQEHHDEIGNRFPKVMRRVSGYNLDAFLPPEEGGQPGHWNLANLIVGSEGTLAVLLEATIRLEPLPTATALCVVHFNDIQKSLKAVIPILEHNPSAIELLDNNVLFEAQHNRSTKAIADFLDGAPEAIQIVEFFGESREEAEHRAQALAESLTSQGIGYAWPVRSDPGAIQRVWEVRKLGLGLISNVPGPRKGAEFIEDACVPVGVLPEYIADVTRICQSHGVGLTVYAHASVGVLHVRPKLDLHDPDDVRRMEQIAEEVFQRVLYYGGSFSGEHGDGLIRGAFVPRFFGPVIYQAFREVKRLFDPQGIMNPGKIVDSPPMTTHLRYPQNVGMGQRCPPTVFQYREDGGFAEAVEKCNGIGACRKMGSGTMCPSYMATREEEDSTRGRANALRMAISGHVGTDALTSDRMAEVLDLCLACKACKAECPNGVDMARLKSDFLHWRNEAKGISWNAWFVAKMPQMARYISGPLASTANALQRFPWVRWILQGMLGFDLRRTLPDFSSQSLSAWFAHRRQEKSLRDSPNDQNRRLAADSSERRRVGIFCDTFVNYFEPHIGQAAVELLEACGFCVELLDVGCCQRPAISKGVLKQAVVEGARTVSHLAARIEPLEAVVVLEPSCWTALVDDLPDLVNAETGMANVAAKMVLVDEFLAREFESGRLTAQLTSPFKQVLVHGHCHQKALSSGGTTRRLLARVAGLVVSEIDSGCCGMAGSFGYDHHDLSQIIGEDRLFPAVRARSAETQIVACGTSCRHQLRDFLGVRAYHVVEVLRATR